MARYLDRLIERAAGAAPALPPLVPAPRGLAGSVLDPAAEERPPVAAPTHVTELVREASVIERHVQVPPPAPPPPARASTTPASAVREIVQAPAAAPVMPQPIANPQAATLAEPEAPRASVDSSRLRIPDQDSTPPVDRWLAPPATEVSERTEPAPVTPPRTPPAPSPESPRALMPTPPAANAPHIDERPTLSIGRLVVEVRQQPVAAPTPPTVVHVAAPAPAAPAPTVLDRGFGLGQS